MLATPIVPPVPQNEQKLSDCDKNVDNRHTLPLFMAHNGRIDIISSVDVEYLRTKLEGPRGWMKLLTIHASAPDAQPRGIFHLVGILQMPLNERCRHIQGLQKVVLMTEKGR